MQRSLAVDASCHEGGESPNDGIFAPSFLAVGIAFRKHGDSRGGKTSLLPSSTLCVGTPADAVCSEL